MNQQAGQQLFQDFLKKNLLTNSSTSEIMEAWIRRDMLGVDGESGRLFRRQLFNDGLLTQQPKTVIMESWSNRGGWTAAAPHVYVTIGTRKSIQNSNQKVVDLPSKIRHNGGMFNQPQEIAMNSYEFLASLDAAEYAALQAEINAVDFGAGLVYSEAVAVEVTEEQLEDVPF